MTDRLYYQDSFLYDFDAEIRAVANEPRPALILDRTAFYPTSGGQIHDTGWVSPQTPGANSNARFRVTEVADTEDGHVVHYLEAPVKDLQPGTRVHGEIDAARRRDHMQQHSAQHVISAAFVKWFDMPTVSFHMAADYCSIDLDTQSLTKDQVEAAERAANEIVLENRVVDIRFVGREEAVTLGLRKLPPAERDRLRLIDIRDVDLSACGGTHVSHTGQIGAILLRKFERVRQGYRVEFVAGQRAVTVARRDFTALSEAGASFSAHIYDVPEQVRKGLDEIKSLHKQNGNLLEELAAAQASALLAECAETNGSKLITRVLTDRDMNFVKLLAQKLTRLANNVVALLASESPLPVIVFAQSAGQPHDMGALLKETVAQLGGRGGGSKDLAQGGVPKGDTLKAAIEAVAQKIAQ
ncbi:MAG TPA: DHHA1 domain-containing protein [Candidatus Binatia bacterium]|nr:DHHA1 domain-containing protein [Candidatus Binatia bacterium]